MSAWHNFGIRINRINYRNHSCLAINLLGFMLLKNHGTNDSFSGIRSIKRTLKYRTFSTIALERFIEDLYLKRALLNSFGFIFVTQLILLKSQVHTEFLFLCSEANHTSRVCTLFTQLKRKVSYIIPQSFRLLLFLPE